MTAPSPIHVRRIHLRGFMCHGDSVLTLPAQGVTLVSGGNGSGKSSLISAVSTALWGEEITGRNPWPAGGGEVTVETDALTVTRTRGKGATGRPGKLGLRWCPVGGVDPVYESAAKADEALGERVGDFAVWARSHVFARSDANAFADASDGERKRLLERMIGLDGFDDALARCREDLKTAQRVEVARSVEVTQRMAHILDLEDRIARASEDALPEHVEPARLDLAGEVYRLALADGREVMAAPATAGANARALTVNLNRLLAAVQSAPTACPTCRRPFALEEGAATKDHLAGEVGALRAEIDAARAVADAALIAATAYDLNVLQPARSALEALQQRETAATSADRMRKLIAADAHALIAKRNEHAALAGQVTDLRARVALLAAAEHALGLKGLRGHVLGSALPVLSEAATAWVSRFGRPEWSIRLDPSGLTAAGARKDELALVLSGTPCEGGYRALSEGEKHRVKLALIVALGQLAAAAYQRPVGTLFFDEALDAPLDAAGAADVGGALRDLAEAHRCCVVVIAHSPDVADTLRPDKHIVVAGGKLTVVKGAGL